MSVEWIPLSNGTGSFAAWSIRKVGKDKSLEDLVERKGELDVLTCIVY